MDDLIQVRLLGGPFTWQGTGTPGIRDECGYAMWVDDPREGIHIPNMLPGHCAEYLPTDETIRIETGSAPEVHRVHRWSGFKPCDHTSHT